MRLENGWRVQAAGKALTNAVCQVWYGATASDFAAVDKVDAWHSDVCRSLQQVTAIGGSGSIDGISRCSMSAFHSRSSATFTV